jgi:uncharacterized protein YndB with AHSA1/START domain
MTQHIFQNTFTIERSYNATPAQVFHAFSDATKKRRWFAEGDGFTVVSYTHDFRIGGSERCVFRAGDGPEVTFAGTYLDIAENKYLIYAYSMTAGNVPISSSISTVELASSGKGTSMLFTEHTCYTDGTDGSKERKQGTVELLEALAKEIAAHG